MKIALPASLLSFGIGSEKEFLVDNLSVLLRSGMDVLTSLKAISAETRSSRLKELIGRMIADVENGEPVWRAISSTHLFPPETISLLRIGEETGRLVDNLRILALQKQKDRMFRSKVVGAMAYPIFILFFGAIVGFWVLFYLLPQLASTFASLNLPLPFVTKTLINLGLFTKDHWAWMMPLVLGSFFTVFTVGFLIPRTRFIGQFVLMHTPGIGRLLKDAETGRVGYLLGTLLGAGVDLVSAVQSIASASAYASFRSFFHFLALQLEEGRTFEQAFAAYKKSRRVLSIPMQQLVISAEHSGSVPQAFLSIGELYQFRADIAAKNLTVVLEPLLLLVVGISVLFLALSVVMPIYSLIGSIG